VTVVVPRSLSPHADTSGRIEVNQLGVPPLPPPYGAVKRNRQHDIADDHAALSAGGADVRARFSFDGSIRFGDGFDCDGLGDRRDAKQCSTQAKLLSHIDLSFGLPGPPTTGSLRGSSCLH